MLPGLGVVFLFLTGMQGENNTAFTRRGEIFGDFDAVRTRVGRRVEAIVGLAIHVVGAGGLEIGRGVRGGDGKPL